MFQCTRNPRCMWLQPTHIAKKSIVWMSTSTVVLPLVRIIYSLDVIIPAYHETELNCEVLFYPLTHGLLFLDCVLKHLNRIDDNRPIFHSNDQSFQWKVGRHHTCIIFDYKWTRGGVSKHYCPKYFWDCWWWESPFTFGKKVLQRSISYSNDSYFPN